MERHEPEPEPEKENESRESCVVVVLGSEESGGEGCEGVGEDEEEEESGDEVFHQLTLLQRAISEPSFHGSITPRRGRETRKIRRERKHTESLSERIQKRAQAGRKRKATSVNEIVQYFNSNTTDIQQANKKRKSVSSQAQDIEISPTMSQDDRGDVSEGRNENEGGEETEMAVESDGEGETVERNEEATVTITTEDNPKTSTTTNGVEDRGQERAMERVMDMMMKRMEENYRKTEEKLEKRDKRAEEKREEERRQEKEERDRGERERDRERKRDRDTWEEGHEKLRTEIRKMQQEHGNVADEVGKMLEEKIMGEMEKMKEGMATHQENQNNVLQKHSAEINRKVMKLESELSGLKEQNTSITDHFGKISKNGGLHMGSVSQQHEDHDMVRMLREASLVSRQKILVQIPIKPFPHPWSEATGSWKDMRNSDKNTAIKALLEHIPSLKNYYTSGGRAAEFTGGTLEKAMVEARRMGRANTKGDLRNVQLTFASSGDAELIAREYSLIKEETEKKWDELLKPYLDWIKKGRPSDQDRPPHPGKTILKVEDAVHPLIRTIVGKERALNNEINAIRPEHTAYFVYDKDRQAVYQRDKDGRKIEKHLTDLAYSKAKADLMRQKKQNAESLGDFSTGGWNTRQQYGRQSNNQQRQELPNRGAFSRRPSQGQATGYAGGQIRSQNFEQRGGQVNQEVNLYRRRVMRNIDSVLEARLNPHENSEDLMPDIGMDYGGGEQY